MKMKNFGLLSVLIVFLTVEGFAFTLSKEAQISLLTCSPGSELYSLFGHTAIRITDPTARFDQVFNYGTFDFNTPHFYLKYAKGLLPYQLTISPYPYFIANYQEEKRSVYSQTLKLDSLQKQKMFDLLLENYKPQNRSYLYNFLFDNCTTRSRDVLVNSLSDKIDWRTSDNGKSFWNLLDEYLQASPWVQWGIHTILGQRGNRTATTFQYMFLPDYLMWGLDSAYYNGQPLAPEIETLYQAPQEKSTIQWYTHPTFVFSCVVLFIIVLFQTISSRKSLQFTAFLLFTFTGILGCLIVFLGGFTAHPITAPNWNILWANPLNLLVVPFLFKRHLPHLLKFYLLLYTTIVFIGILLWYFLMPAVPTATYSLMLLMIYLSLKIIHTNKEKNTFSVL